MHHHYKKGVFGMAKKGWGKFVAFAAVTGAVAAGVSYVLQYKTYHRELEKDFDQAFFRDVRLYSLLERRCGRINPEFIQDCLKDHYRENPESGEAVCNHDERWAVTIASQIYDLTAKEAFVCCGNPCEGTYRHYSL